MYQYRIHNPASRVYDKQADPARTDKRSQKTSSQCGRTVKQPIDQPEQEKIHHIIHCKQDIYENFIVHKTPPIPVEYVLTGISKYYYMG